MSTYITRNVEVKIPVYNRVDEENQAPEIGETRYFPKDRQYKEWTGTEWIEKIPDYTWHWIKPSFCNSGGSFRDNILGFYSPYDKIKERGLPEDCNPELRESIESDKFLYKHTWITLTELKEILEKEIQELKTEILEVNEKSILSQKIDRIEKLIKKENPEQIEEPDYYDSLDYVLEEGKLQTVLAINTEISRVEHMIDNSNLPWCSEDNVRIIYYFS